MECKYVRFLNIGDFSKIYGGKVVVLNVVEKVPIACMLWQV